MEFKIGDIVDWNGEEGQVIYIADASHTYPIRVSFGYDIIEFTMSGYVRIGQSKNPLTLKERPKKKVNKTFYSMITPCLGSPGSAKYSLGFLFDSEADCRAYFGVDYNTYTILQIQMEVDN